MATIENAGPRLSELDVSNLEMRLGVTLPEQYRKFLFDFNGGSPAPDTISIEGLPGVSSDVQVLFGIGRAAESSGIEWNLATLAERLEEGLLPIATDSGGSVYCISLREHDCGTIFYCDLESVFAVYESRPNIYPVASDFNTFLEKLRPFS